MRFSKKKLFQVGALCGFIDKVYLGDYTLGEIAKKGNLGIGTFDDVHGELIGFDGKFYRIIEDGIAKLVDPNQKSPFAWVVDFEETQQFTLKNIKSLDQFSEEFDKHILSKNYIYAYQFKCMMRKMQCRTELCQPKPYKPLSETFSKVQVDFSYDDINGVAVGFRFPDYLSTLNIPGHHVHFLDPDGMKGGHVFGFEFVSADISVCCIKNFEVALIESDTFQQLDTSVQDIAHATSMIEKQQ